tara:strand:- start:140 stop:583 length:444 start_codon:yes stop_codon:yes gene_type:complete
MKDTEKKDTENWNDLIGKSARVEIAAGIFIPVTIDIVYTHDSGDARVVSLDADGFEHDSLIDDIELDEEAELTARRDYDKLAVQVAILQHRCAEFKKVAIIAAERPFFGGAGLWMETVQQAALLALAADTPRIIVDKIKSKRISHKP